MGIGSAARMFLCSREFLRIKLPRAQSLLEELYDEDEGKIVVFAHSIYMIDALV